MMGPAVGLKVPVLWGGLRAECAGLWGRLRVEGPGLVRPVAGLKVRGWRG